MENEKQLQTEEQVKLQAKLQQQAKPAENNISSQTETQSSEKPQTQEKQQDKNNLSQEKLLEEKTKPPKGGKGWLWIIPILATGILIFVFGSGTTNNQNGDDQAPITSGNEENQPSENTDVAPEGKNLFLVNEVIDGDTITIEDGTQVRLLGIDADEEGSSCFSEAKKRVEELVLNKNVELVADKTDKDKYDRLLRYIFLDNQNINLELVKEGLAVCQFYEPDIKYKEDCENLENEAKNKKTGCEWEEKITAPSSELKWESLSMEKTGLEVIKAAEAKNYTGKEKIVEGEVASTKKYTNPALYINFCHPYPNQCFMTVVLEKDWQKFPANADVLYDQKTVRVKGAIKEYKGQTEIILTDPSQIEIGK